MREMASLASAYGRQKLPASLMQRLELMQQLALATQPNVHIQHRPRGSRRGAHAIVLGWFSLGVLVSGALGAGTIVAMRAQAAGATPLPSIVSLFPMRWAAWAKASPTPTPAAPGHEAAWDTVQVAMGRAERVPLPLQVTGPDGAVFEVVIDGLPAGVKPSRGTPRGQAWMLGPDDLEGLFLTLDDTAPAAFDVRIALSAPTTVATAGSIVQVRLSDLPEQGQAAMTGGRDGLRAGPAGARISEVASSGSIRGEGGTTPRAPGEGDTAKVTRETADPAQRATANAAAAGAETAGRRPWPEGASALGAVSREPDSPPWWQMPPPSWSPFVVGQERP